MITTNRTNDTEDMIQYFSPEFSKSREEKVLTKRIKSKKRKSIKMFCERL